MAQMVGYARVSTEEQRPDLQLDALRKAGVAKCDIYVEKVSAASKRRPELDLCIKALREGDTLVVWRLDRLARSMQELYSRLDQIHTAGATFKSLSEGFDFTSATGRFMLAVLGAVAQMERDLISARTSAGIQAWRDRGGSPGRRVQFTKDKQAKARQMLRQGMTVKEVAERFKVSTSLLHQRGLRVRKK
jgi:DNA invertase Pin-like site-specific DNA recombinase